MHYKYFMLHRRGSSSDIDPAPPNMTEHLAISLTPNGLKSSIKICFTQNSKSWHLKQTKNDKIKANKVYFFFFYKKVKWKSYKLFKFTQCIWQRQAYFSQQTCLPDPFHFTPSEKQVIRGLEVQVCTWDIQYSQSTWAEKVKKYHSGTQGWRFVGSK